MPRIASPSARSLVSLHVVPDVGTVRCFLTWFLFRKNLDQRFVFLRNFTIMLHLMRVAWRAIEKTYISPAACNLQLSVVVHLRLQVMDYSMWLRLTVVGIAETVDTVQFRDNWITVKRRHRCCYELSTARISVELRVELYPILAELLLKELFSWTKRK